jgi:hypothetical protein
VATQLPQLKQEQVEQELILILLSLLQQAQVLADSMQAVVAVVCTLALQLQEQVVQAVVEQVRFQWLVE